MATGRTKRELAEEFAARLKRELGANVRRVILYGSVARGDETPGSDIDVVLVVQDAHRVDRLSGVLGEWMAETGLLVDLLVVDEAELARVHGRGSAFSHDLRDEGVTLA